MLSDNSPGSSASLLESGLLHTHNICHYFAAMDIKDMPQQSQMDHVSVNGKRSGSFLVGVSEKGTTQETYMYGYVLYNTMDILSLTIQDFEHRLD